MSKKDLTRLFDNAFTIPFDDEDKIVDDKIMLTMLGGVKQYGSSVYDYSEPHKVEEIKFIEKEKETIDSNKTLRELLEDSEMK